MQQWTREGSSSIDRLHSRLEIGMYRECQTYSPGWVFSSFAFLLLCRVLRILRVKQAHWKSVALIGQERNCSLTLFGEITRTFASWDQYEFFLSLPPHTDSSICASLFLYLFFYHGVSSKPTSFCFFLSSLSLGHIFRHTEMTLLLLEIPEIQRSSRGWDGDMVWS